MIINISNNITFIMYFYNLYYITIIYVIKYKKNICI